mmetsp:Transcript_67860/g.107624  ORF Transcript_67860/g.107624 Transcript_67860/m.107624 type:complete len:255 (+) Transcript_67860:75-839(+)
MGTGSLLQKDAQAQPLGLTRKASVVQLISTAIFLILGIGLAVARPNMQAPSSFDSCNIRNMLWLIVLTFIVEALGQTPLALAGWFSDQPDNDTVDFRDEFIYSNKWKETTNKIVPWCSYAAYLAFLVIIPTARFMMLCWALSASAWAYKIVLVVGALSTLSLIHVMFTWKQTFRKYVLLYFLMAPLLSGLALLWASFQAASPATSIGLAACGASLFAYFLMFPVCGAVDAMKRWHAEIVNLLIWSLLAWGALKL